MTDSTSPDGKRVLYEGKDWDRERESLAQAAGHRCEGCERPHPLPFSEAGCGHHKFGRGAGRRDDRMWRLINPSVQNLLEMFWVRNLLWVCHVSHDEIHRRALPPFRHHLMRWCPIQGRILQADE